MQRKHLLESQRENLTEALVNLLCSTHLIIQSVFYYHLSFTGGDLQSSGDSDSDEESSRRAAIRDIGHSQQNPDSRVSMSPQHTPNEGEHQDEVDDERTFIHTNKCMCLVFA